MDGLNIIFDTRVASLFAAILLLLFLYWYTVRNFDYWKKRNIPFVKGYPIIGSFYEVLRKNLEDVELSRYNKYGRIYGVFEGHKPMLIVGEPELIKNIMVKDFQYFSTRRNIETGEPMLDKMMSQVRGEDWKRIRMIVSPTFSTGKMKRMMNIFRDCARTVEENFKSEEMKRQVVDVLKIYGAFTIDVIASSAFSTKLDSHKNPENEFVKNAKAAFTQKFGLRIVMFIFMPKVMKTLNIPFLDTRHMRFFKRVTLDIIDERRRTGQKRNDFLQLLMDAAEEAEKIEQMDEKKDNITANYAEESADHPIFKADIPKHLSMDELLAQCVIFFLAGYHTTTTTLGLATYLLALNQDSQNKLFSEIKQVLNETEGEITYEAVQKMKYLDNIISETLRLYSPALRIDRTAEADYELGDTGITIPKGMVVGIPNFAMHRDPEFFPDPEKFDPDRFSPEEREKRIPYSYLPFGSGPRNCVGMRFALLEIKVCLLHVFSKFHVKTCWETKIPLEFGQASGVLYPKSINLHLELREDCPLKI